MDLRRAVGSLQASLSGFVALPGTAPYEQTLDIDNGRVRLPPALVVYPRSVPDVSRALRFARDEGLPLTAKGGGHSAAGYALNRGGVVLDLSLMKEMRFDADRERLSVQLGARWEDVYGHLLGIGTPLIPVGGGCVTVGLAGFLLGGGFSFASRSYGLGADNLVSVDLVTADGEGHHLTADAESEEDRDLFWACQGGGGGNFGVAVAVELQLRQPPTAPMLEGQFWYTLDRAEETIGAYNEWTAGLPDQMAAYGYLGTEADPADSSRQALAFRVTPVYNGPYKEGLELLQPLLRLAPASVTLTDLPLPVWESTVGTSTLGDRQAYIRSAVMGEGAMTPDVIEVYRRFMGSSPSADSFVVWTHTGGQVEAVAPDATAYPHREARFVFELKSIWTEPIDTRANVEWAYRFGEALRPHLMGAYANYIDPLLTDWRTMYYGGNYDRLLRIKHAVDPDGFFRFQQGIGSEFEPSDAEPLDLSPLNRTLSDPQEEARM